jgi:LuxR family transcriptional regulator, maltose regulon positive regulatory protein
MDALTVSQAHGESVLLATPELHVALSELDREAGDLSDAAAHLEQATGLGEGAPMAEGHYRWFVARARICQAEGDLQGALDLLDQAQTRFRSGFYPDVRPIAAMKARIWISQGNLAAAKDWTSSEGVSVDDRVDYMHEFDHLTLVRLLIARQRTGPDEEMMGSVLELLSRLVEAAQANGRAGSVIEIRVLQALALEAQQRLDEAVGCLQEAWDEAADPTGYARLFLDEGPPMVRLLAEVGRRGDSDHASRLLRIARGDGGEKPGVESGTAGTSADTLSQRELQVLKMLESELSGPGIAEALFVSHNTVRTHTQHIFTKLDVTNRRAAVLRGREIGLL